MSTSTEHERLLEAAKEAIDALFGDTTVSPEKTLDSLEDLKSDIAIKIQAIEDDLPED